MLVNCPRCGFSQPKDKYCAQCGVDTETYKPPQVSAFQKHLKNPLLFLGIALVALVAYFKTLHRPSDATITERVRYLKGTSQAFSEAKPEPTVQVEASASREIAAVAESEPAMPLTGAVAASQTVAAASTSTAGSQAATASASTAGSAANSAVNPDEPSAFIYYAEVPRQALEKIYEASQATGQFNNFGDYTAGILPDVEKRIESLKIKVHEKTLSNVGRDKPGLFTGIHDEELNEDIGLTTYIQVAEEVNGEYRGRLQIVRAWREMAENGNGSTVRKNSYPAIFELPPGAGFFFAGVLPRKSNLLHDEKLTSIGAFQILNSDMFKSKESEFVIFVEFRKKP